MHQKINELIMVLGKDSRISLLAEISREAGIKVCLVGGFIRDCVLGKMPVDMDFVISKNAERIIRKFAGNLRGKLIVLGREPKISYRVAAGGDIIDFVNAYNNDFGKDLSKRDFTINAVALDINSRQVLDPFNGLGDMDNRIIREVSSECLKDDPLRVIRAIRYASTIDGMKIESATYCHMKEQSSNIVNTAFERFAEEINKMFGSFNPEVGLKLILETRIIEHILHFSIPHRIGKTSSISAAEDIEGRFVKEISPIIIRSFSKREYENVMPLAGNQKALWVSSLLILFMKRFEFPLSDLKDVMRFMRLSGKDIARICNIISGTLELFKISSEDFGDDALKLFIGHNGKDFVLMQALYEGFTYLDDVDVGYSEKMLGRMSELFIKNSEVLLSPARIVSGYDVKKILKVPDGGERIGFILREISDLQFTGLIENRDDALEYIRSCKDD